MSLETSIIGSGHPLHRIQLKRHRFFAWWLTHLLLDGDSFLLTVSTLRSRWRFDTITCTSHTKAVPLAVIKESPEVLLDGIVYSPDLAERCCAISPGYKSPNGQVWHAIDGMNSTEVLEEVENATILMTKFDSSPRQWVKIEVQFSGLLRSCTRWLGDHQPTPVKVFRSRTSLDLVKQHRQSCHDWSFRDFFKPSAFRGFAEATDDESVILADLDRNESRFFKAVDGKVIDLRYQNSITMDHVLLRSSGSQY